MMKLALSPAAACLLRAIINRAGVDRSRVLLGEFKSIDWQSLTFIGERHEISLRITGADATAVAQRITADLEDDDFAIPGHIVADVRLAQPPIHHRDGAVSLFIEALTLQE